MHVMNEINRKMEKGSVGIAPSGLNHGWAMRQEKKSPKYTTDLDELPVVSWKHNYRADIFLQKMGGVKNSPPS